MKVVIDLPDMPAVSKLHSACVQGNPIPPDVAICVVKQLQGAVDEFAAEQKAAKQKVVYGESNEDRQARMRRERNERTDALSAKRRAGQRVEG
jgi:hypothetical protein